jgi:hypothetical protein
MVPDAPRPTRPGSVSPSRRHHSQSPGGSRPQAQVGAVVAPAATGANKRPGSPHPSRPSTPTPIHNTTQSDRSHAKVQVAYAGDHQDGPARVLSVTCGTAADTEANEMAGLSVGDCVLRSGRGELHTVIAIDRSLSPIACTVHNPTTGAVVDTELSFLSLPERGPEPDTSVQSTTAATLSTSDRNTEATATTSELHAVDESLTAARIQRRLLLQRQLQQTARAVALLGRSDMSDKAAKLN